MLTTKNYYTMESVIKKLQSTPIKFKSNFEIINIINNIKALQNTPLIIIVGEVHSDDLNNESYYLNDLKKLEEKNVDLDLVIYVLIFLLVVYICYRVARSQLRKLVFFLILLLII